MGLDYKSLYEALILELEFLKNEGETLKEENDLLEKIRMIQTRHLLDRERKIKDLGGKLIDK
ncbi:hypothetical protein [Pedobacter frigoris]|uniref:Uncharacterized protein n=1 Tax=Pedobacter frigoris TaxID=2571272 RepID=A0A4U1CDE8_9SPHI|nr:hypothetical protein [Pedobacter frigoris]TKC04988.1 hypothetical protein FA047_14560 [Pedobacter frigoris]